MKECCVPIGYDRFNRKSLRDIGVVENNACAFNLSVMHFPFSACAVENNVIVFIFNTVVKQSGSLA